MLRLLGANIDEGCYIGFTLILASEIMLGNNVRIGHFNLLSRLTMLNLETGSRIGDFNWVTGALAGAFSLGRNSSVRRFHFIEASGGVTIGDNTIIAGRSTQMFTHGLSSTCLDDVRPIHIGDWCYVGAACRFLPGTVIARGTFVGMGSVVTKTFSDEFVLIAGCPATVKKRLSPNDAYFARSFLRHAHHPAGYTG